MSIYRRNDCSVWWISIYDAAGRRRRFSSKSKDRDVALAMEASLNASVRGNLSRDRLIQTIDSLAGWSSDGVAGSPVADLWPTYLQTAPRAGKDTIARRRRICEDFCGWIKSTRPSVRVLQDVSPQVAQAFSDWMAFEHPAGGKAHNNRIGNLKTVFQAVATRAGLLSNPFALVQRADESGARSGRAFTREEEGRLLGVCEGSWLSVSLVARFTGLRYKDIALLKGGDVAKGWISVCPNKTAKRGITVKIPVHDRIAEHLPKRPADEFYWPDHARRYYDGFQKPTGYNDLIRAAKIDPKGAVLSFHCWRHTFRTRLAEAGVSQEIAMKLGGWTEKTTAEIYNHDLTGIEAAIRAMD